MQPLTGKTALVTGGSRGIGAAIATRLAAAGAEVSLTYARSKQQAQTVIADIHAAGGTAQALHADNCDPEAVALAVRQTASAGGLDILVLNAGIFETGEIGDLTLETFDRTLDVNLRAAFVAVNAASEHLRAGGRIIMIGSNLAVRVPGPGLSLYALSKAALIGFTKGLARDLGARQITVNIVHPGSTDTDMNPAGGPFAEPQRQLMAIPRFNRPDEVAELVAWLAGPAARGTTGSEFTIDGGANI